MLPASVASEQGSEHVALCVRRVRCDFLQLVLDGFLEEKFLIDALEDAEVRRDTRLEREFPQKARAEGVNR